MCLNCLPQKLHSVERGTLLVDADGNSHGPVGTARECLQRSGKVTGPAILDECHCGEHTIPIRTFKRRQQRVAESGTPIGLQQGNRPSHLLRRAVLLVSVGHPAIMVQQDMQLTLPIMRGALGSLPLWPEERARLLLPLPVLAELRSLDSIRDANEVLDRLRSIDWSFTDDDTAYLAHDLHPYPAKFIPQIPGNLISALSRRGEVVWDPFGGSGTTALEALLLGRRAISSDLNPLSTLIT